MSYKSSRFTGGHARNLSTSSSDYSYESDATSTRRESTPSKGGADRRRVAIMQMPSLRSRRGLKSDLTGLALVTPPDVAPTNYTPPSTANNFSDDQDTKKDISTTKDISDDDQNSSRFPRSCSPSSSRGLTTSSMFPPTTPDIGQGKDIHIPVAGPIVVNLDSHLRKAPSFISSGTNTPPPDTTLLATPTSSTPHSYLHYQPGVHSVAGPLPPPPRANFNINIHSPPPPRPPRLHSPAPTRLKRDLDAVKHSLQLPPSVAAILASKSSSSLSTKSDIGDPSNDVSDVDSKSDIKPSSTKSDITDVDFKSDIKPSSEHRREGSFSPADDIPAKPASSEITSGSTTTKSLEILNIENKDTILDNTIIPSVTVVEPQPHRTPTKIDHHKFSEWLKSNPDLSQPLGTGRRGSSVDEMHLYNHGLPVSPDRSDFGAVSDTPSPPPKSLRRSLTMSIKRLSLPRTASLSSKSGRRLSGNTHRSSRTPSPSIHHVSPPPLVPKIRSANPAALFCHEVHCQRTTSERCLIYATKINELHLFDCGLSEWVVNMKSRGPNSQSQRAPSTEPFAPQPRHTSRSSAISEATFPSRPDASTATDLSQDTYGHISPTSVSLTLPYPSLAMNPPRTNPSRSNSSVGPSPSIRSLAPSTSVSMKSGGFFASLGRKASLSKKEKPSNMFISSSPSSSLSSPRLLSISSSKHTPSLSLNTSTMNISRPYISSPISVPGGPRAPHRTPQRSHTFTPSFPPRSTVVNSDIGRRPSMFDLSLDPVIDICAEPEFDQHVDKLAGLLPHANRDTLAGYLRRAGQDMLAIGQYLQDEKNGTIQSYD